MRFAEPFLTITPTVDGEVFAVLAPDEVWRTIDELHALIDHRSPEGIRLVVRRLAEQGVIESQRAGRGSVHRLNRAHVAADAILAISGLREAFSARLRAHVAAWPLPPTSVDFVALADGEETEVIEVTLGRPAGAGEEWASFAAQLVMDIYAWTGSEARIVELGATALPVDAAGVEGEAPVG